MHVCTHVCTHVRTHVCTHVCPLHMSRRTSGHTVKHTPGHAPTRIHAAFAYRPDRMPARNSAHLPPCRRMPAQLAMHTFVHMCGPRIAVRTASMQVCSNFVAVPSPTHGISPFCPRTSNANAARARIFFLGSRTRSGQCDGGHRGLKVASRLFLMLPSDPLSPPAFACCMLTSQYIFTLAQLCWAVLSCQLWLPIRPHLLPHEQSIRSACHTHLRTYACRRTHTCTSSREERSCTLATIDPK